MRSSLHTWGRTTVRVTLLGIAGLFVLNGCGSGGTGWDYLGSPFYYAPTSSGTSGPSSTGQTTAGQLSQNDRTPVDPCTEPLASKYITISMRNLSSEYIHYFFVAIAFVDVDESDDNAIVPTFDSNPFPNGAVCPEDIPLYRQNGYIEIGSGAFVEFGDYCITGPALYYYHKNGSFRTSAGTGTTGLGSAIAPAQGTIPTYDNFFGSGGARLPIPDIILFHNPGGTLKISRSVVEPCSLLSVVGDPICERDSFYYVSEDDVIAGSRDLGLGSGRRVPNNVQGAGCECLGVSQPYQLLAPSRLPAIGLNCSEFMRGGRIDYLFVQVNETPLPPQLLWRVTDAFGSLVHDFDARSILSGG